MKNIIKIIMLSFFFINCKAQTPTTVNISTYNQGDNANKYFKDINNNYNNFVGTWQCTSGNITFRLIIWKTAMVLNTSDINCFMDDLNAKYLIIQNAGTSNETVLFNSIKYFPQNGYTSNSIMTAFALNNFSFSGAFTDTNANNGNYVLDGAFSFEITNIGNLPLQAIWNLKSTKQLQPGENFIVPTNCILTKQ